MGFLTTGYALLSFAVHCDSISQICYSSYVGMLADPNWRFHDSQSSRLCYVKLQNNIALCCSEADYASARFSDCDTSVECHVDCKYQAMETFCDSWIGKGCSIEYQLSNRFPLPAEASICVPSSCVGEESEMLSYFRPELGGTATIFCSSNIGRKVGIGIGATIAILIVTGFCFFAVRVPRGKHGNFKEPGNFEKPDNEKNQVHSHSRRALNGLPLRTKPSYIPLEGESVIQ